MPKFYIIPSHILLNIAKTAGISMGVISDVLTTYAEEVAAECPPSVVDKWIKVNNKSGIEIPEFVGPLLEVWDSTFTKANFGVYLGFCDGKYYLKGVIDENHI